MPTPPTFTTGSILTAAQMNAVGLWLVKSQTVGSGVSSVTVTGAFSADYDSYKIVYSGGVCSTSAHVGLSLGSTATGYYGGLIYTNVAVPSAAAALDSNAASWTYSTGGNANQMLANLDLHNPFLARYTLINADNLSYLNFGTYNGYLANTTSYTAFTLTPSGGATLTGGTISIYGYRKA